MSRNFLPVVTPMGCTGSAKIKFQFYCKTAVSKAQHLKKIVLCVYRHYLFTKIKNSITYIDTLIAH